MAYKYNPGCCCDCEFIDPFDRTETGYLNATHSESPVFSVESGLLSLTDGDAARYRTVTFDADAEAGAVSVSAVLPSSSAEAGVFIGGQWAFLIDWPGQRLLVRPVDANGVAAGEDIVVEGPALNSGDKIDLRLGWSELLDSWRVEVLLNNVALPYFSEPVTFTGKTHRFGIVGTDGAVWDSYQQNCHSGLSSIFLCVDGYPGACVEIPHPRVNVQWDNLHWNSIPSATNAPDNSDSYVTSAQGVPIVPSPNPTQAMGANWISGSQFSLAIPDVATISSVRGFVRYRTSIGLGGLSGSYRVKGQAHQSGTPIGSAVIGFSGGSVGAYLETNFLFSGVLWTPEILNDPNFGYLFHVQRFSSQEFPTKAWAFFVDTLRIEVCYSIDV